MAAIEIKHGTSTWTLDVDEVDIQHLVRMEREVRKISPGTTFLQIHTGVFRGAAVSMLAYVWLARTLDGEKIGIEECRFNLNDIEFKAVPEPTDAAPAEPVDVEAEDGAVPDPPQSATSRSRRRLSTTSRSS